MAGIVRKLFKGSGSTKKPSKKEKRETFEDDDEDDDYAELDFGPSSSSTPGPSKYHQSQIQFTSQGLPLTIATPKLRHDDTIDSPNEQSFEQPTQKRRRVADPDIFENEETMYEHTQYQLMKWERQEKRHQERRKRKRVERNVEQENYVHSALASIKLEQPTVADVEKLRKERDGYKKEMEKYKRKFEDLEMKYKNLERRQQQTTPVFQPFMPGFNFFGGATPTPYQPFFPPALPPTFLFQQPTTSSSQNPSSSMSFVPPPSFINPTPLPTSDTFPMLASSGPMAPRYPEPYNFSQDDDDTSLSDLSNSSKSDISSDGIKL